MTTHTQKYAVAFSLSSARLFCLETWYGQLACAIFHRFTACMNCDLREGAPEVFVGVRAVSIVDNG